MIGHSSVDLYSILKLTNGKCDNYELTLDLKAQPRGEGRGEGEVEVGVLYVRLTGVSVNLETLGRTGHVTTLNSSPVESSSMSVSTSPIPSASTR